jgi:flagellar protein FliS
MRKSQAELKYLRTAAQSATSVGLVIILYDLLVADLERAMAAIAERDIEKRSAEISHAFLVLQQLEGSLDMKKGGQTAIHLSRFYSVLRCNILEAQIKVSPEILKKQIKLILDVREAWQKVDIPREATATVATAEPGVQQTRAAAASGGESGAASSWTA